MLPLQPSETLKSKTYLALVLSQFLAAFNDQAVHIAAIFYASDMLVRFVGAHGVDEKLVISLVTGCFISPFFFFSPLAGVLADKYSKRKIIVFWKVAEVAIMSLALIGFLLPHLGSLSGIDQRIVAQWSAALVVATVFMMGTHSAFFVPAKYGVMPEILAPSVLSRGNGLLEGTSFVAQILGTSFGGFLYLKVKSTVELVDGVSVLHPGQEWIIGLVLLALALIGAVAAFMMRPLPAAAPDRPLIWQPWIPLKKNLGALMHSRSLTLAVIGIAFFSFMTLFLRQTLIFHGETEKEFAETERQLQLVRTPRAARAAPEATEAPEDAEDSIHNPITPEASPTQSAELVITILIALVGLGVGIGCSLAGYLSGDRLELGLVPIGAVFLVLLTAVLAWVVPAPTATIVCLVMIGISAGLYIVPLYTLLQHRAPKDSKGNLVATSNFLNVAGGLIAVAVFYFLTFGVQKVLHLDITHQDILNHPEKLGRYHGQLRTLLQVPRILFLAASVITAIMLLGLCWQRPDFIVRALSLLRNFGRRKLHVVGLENVPTAGSMIVATNCHDYEQLLQVISVTDRLTRFILPSGTPGHNLGLLRYYTRRTSLVVRGDAHDPSNPERLLVVGFKTLEEGHLLGLVLHNGEARDTQQLLETIQSRVPSQILPMHCADYLASRGKRRGPHTATVTIGEPLPANTGVAEIRRVIESLGTVAGVSGVG